MGWLSGTSTEYDAARRESSDSLRRAKRCLAKRDWRSAEVHLENCDAADEEAEKAKPSWW